MIGDNIVVTYLGKNWRGEASIGVSAPKEVLVDREEVRAAKLKGAQP